MRSKRAIAQALKDVDLFNASTRNWVSRKKYKKYSEGPLPLNSGCSEELSIRQQKRKRPSIAKRSNESDSCTQIMT
jgi:hypothetical protein